MVIFVNCIGSTTGITVIKSIRAINDNSIKIIGADSDSFIAGVKWVDKFYEVPKVKDTNYLDTIFDICAKEKVDLYISVLDPEFQLISKNKSRFQNNGTTVVISENATIELCYDKLKTMDVLKKIKINTPKTLSSKEFLDEKSFPLIAKPREGGSGSRNVSIINDVDDKEYFIKKNRLNIDNYIIQEKIIGDEYTIDCLFNFHGKPIYIIPRKRIETKAGISYKGIIVNDKSMIDEVHKISAELKFIGPVCIQVIKDKDGINNYFEINPRFGAATSFTLKGAGINFMETLVKIMRSEVFEISTPRWGAKIIHYWDEVVISW